MLLAFPDFQVGIGFAQKEDFPHGFLARIRGDHENAFLLFDTAQVEQVRIRMHAHHGVGIGRRKIVRVNKSDGVRLQFGTETLSVLFE